MTIARRDDFDVAELEALAVHAPGAARRDRVRDRCHKILARRRWIAALKSRLLDSGGSDRVLADRATAAPLAQE